MERNTVSKALFHLSPLKKISPSRYTAMKSCILKEVWSSAKVQELLPIFPSARLGSVIHNVLELSAKGLITSDNFNEMWLQEVTKVEQVMLNLWQEEHLAPLSKTAKNYDVKRVMCLHNISKTQCKKHKETSNERHFGPEIWVETMDKTVGGRIDLARHIEGDIQLLDYKTGQILAEDNSVKVEYQEQLKLYAALYFQQWGIWPARLSVCGLDHSEVDIEFERSECLKLLDDAKVLLDSVNDRILSNCSIESLSNPSPNACKLCVYRPACKSYWIYRENSSKWPCDFRGLIIKKSLLGNGTIIIDLESDLGRIHIRGLSYDRHKFVLFKKNPVTFCNLKKDYSEGNYCETQLTTGVDG